MKLIKTLTRVPERPTWEVCFASGAGYEWEKGFVSLEDVEQFLAREGNRGAFVEVYSPEGWHYIEG
jgi:hypothetical protein